MKRNIPNAKQRVADAIEELNDVLVVPEDATSAAKHDPTNDELQKKVSELKEIDPKHETACKCWVERRWERREGNLIADVRSIG